MASVNITTLKSYFNAGDEPTEAQFVNVFDSLLSIHADDDTTVAGDTTFSGVTTLSGQAYARGYTSTTPSLIQKWPAHTDATAGNATITIAQVLTGILECDPAADITWTLPTAALAVAGVNGVAVGDCIDFSVISTGTAGDDEIITVAMGSGGTAVGGMTVPNHNDAHDAASVGAGLFRMRFTNVTSTSEAYTVYRLA